MAVDVSPGATWGPGSAVNLKRRGRRKGRYVLTPEDIGNPSTLPVAPVCNSESTDTEHGLLPAGVQGAGALSVLLVALTGCARARAHTHSPPPPGQCQRLSL